jgi:competence protein ComEA
MSDDFFDPPDHQRGSLWAARWANIRREIANKLGLRRISTPAALLLLVLVVALCIWGWLRFGPPREASGGGAMPAPLEERYDNPADSGGEVSTSTPTSATIMVQVVGAVKHVGVYELPLGARGIDAAEAAGGLSRDAAPEGVNLAAVLEDGCQLWIPTKKEWAEGAGSAGSSGGVAGMGVLTSPDASASQGAAVNVNTADQALLETLPGVGPVTAQKIIAEREKAGPFASLDDLQRVSGIGEKRVGALQGLADVK